MSVSVFQWRSCARKKGYTSEKAAQKALAKMRASRRLRRSGDLEGLHVYACAFCGCHHVGHRIGSSTPLGPKTTDWWRFPRREAV
jgi:hypothetical protein